MHSNALNRALPHGVRSGVLVAVVLVNIGLAVGVASGRTKPILLVAILPLLVGPVLRLITAHREVLVFAALALPMMAEALSKPLPGTGGTAIFPADLLVALAVVGYAVSYLTAPPERRPSWPRTTVLSWPFALLAITLLLGVIRGHERYGLPVISQPTRIFLYAGIAAAIGSMTPGRAYKGIVVVFYLGTVWQALLAAYHLATGTVQGGSGDLSTGGSRVLSLGTAIFLSGALVLALLNLDLDDSYPRKLHFAIAGLSAFGIVIALGRTNFAALGVILPVIFLSLRRLRHTVLAYLPLIAAVAVAMAALTITAQPSLGSALKSRFTAPVGTDTAAVQRERKVNAALEGFSRESVFGFGFGRTVQYTSIDRSTKTFSGDPENSYVYILAGGGVVALIALIVLLLVFSVDSFRRIRRAAGESRVLIAFAMAFVFIFVVNAITGPILSDPAYMLTIWISLLLPSVAMRSHANQENDKTFFSVPNTRQ
jgi:O-antigen ligase